MEHFEIISPLRDVQIIARGKGVKIRHWLNKRYGVGRWRKMKAFATIRDERGNIIEAELHWFEAHGIGRVQMKPKTWWYK